MSDEYNKVDIVKTTSIQKNGMTMLPKEFRNWAGNPSKIRWLEAFEEGDGIIIRVKVE